MDSIADERRESNREWFEERAAIMEFEAGMTRANAEAAALELLKTRLRRESEGGQRGA